VAGTARTHEHKLIPVITASSPVEHSISLPGQKRTPALQVERDNQDLQDIATLSLFWNHNRIPTCIWFCCTTHVKDTKGTKEVRMDARNIRLKSTEYFLTQCEGLSSL